MKNDEQMYESVLSRYERYLETRRTRARMIRRTVPVLACFCLAVVLGVGYQRQLRDLPPIPTVPPVTEETAITSINTTMETTVQTDGQARPASVTETSARMHPATTTASDPIVQTEGQTRATSAPPTVTDPTEVRTSVVTTAQIPPAADPPEMTTAGVPADTTALLQTSVTVVTAATTGEAIATEVPDTGVMIDMTGMVDVTPGTGSVTTQTTTTTETTVFLPDPDMALRVREQMTQLITRYALGAHAWVADAAAYPQYADTVVIECDDRAVARTLRIDAIAFDIDTRYLTFVYCEDHSPDT